MKKAYNVYEKANIPAILRSISLAFVFGVCFLGFQTQSSAQADAISVLDRSDIKELHTEYDLASVTAEDALINLRTHAATIINSEQTTTQGELTQVLTQSFATALSSRIQAGATVQNAVMLSFDEVMSSKVAKANAQYVDVKRVLDNIIAIL